MMTRMRTIRLADPPRRHDRNLAFGSSEWAADSCLAEWSQFERDWLGPDPRGRDVPEAREPDPPSPFAAACTGVAAGVWAVVAWTFIRNFWFS